MGTKISSAKCADAPWNAFDDVEAFADAAMAEIRAMRKEKPSLRRVGPRESMDDATQRRVLITVWTVCFGGMQWRTAAFHTEIPFGTLFAFFQRWTRRGLWRRLLGAALKAWRLACGDAEAPSALVIDSRSCRSAPTCGFHGVDGGKKIRGLKLHIAVVKHGFPLSVHVTEANVHDSKAAVVVVENLAADGFVGSLVGDSAYAGPNLAAVGAGHGIDIVSMKCGTGKAFVPREIRWVVERTFAWLSRYRRLNTVFDRTAESFIGFVELAMASLLIRRLSRLEAKA